MVSPYRSRHRRGRYARSENGKEVFLLWLLFVFFGGVFKISTPADRGDDAIVFFMVFTVIAVIAWITDNTRAVGVSFGPFVAAAIVFEIFSSSKDRALWLMAISLSPLLLGYAICSCLTLILPFLFIYHFSSAVCSTLPLLLYTCSFRCLIIRLPRYRRIDPFAQSKLCDPCRSVLKSSSLLFGSWTIFVRTEESHRFYTTIEEMQRSWKGCQMCEALLSQTLEDSQGIAGSLARNYGTITSATSVKSLPDLEEASPIVKIRLHKGSKFYDKFGLQFVIQLQSSNNLKFKEFCVAEGMCVTFDIRLNNMITV
jgi:hypothetical protein